MTANDDYEMPEIIANVKSGLADFAIAFKKVTLYPETNNSRQESMQKFQEWLNAFLLEQDTLRLTVEKDRLIYHGVVVYQDKPNEQSFIYPLFRDGVQWFEFVDGISTEELVTFFNLLNSFRILKEESEDDLVTAMWEMDFLHLNYKTTNEFWEIDPLIDIESLKVNKEVEQDQEDGYYVEVDGDSADYALVPLTSEYDLTRAKSKGGDVKSISTLFSSLGTSPTVRQHSTGRFVLGSGEGPANALLGSRVGGGGAEGAATTHQAGGRETPYFENDKRGVFWALDSDEEATVKAMVAEEEHRNSIQDCFEILIILMKEIQGAASDNLFVLDFVAEEVQYALSQGDFTYVRMFIERLTAMANTDDQRASALAGRALRTIAGTNVVNALSQVWPFAANFTKQVFDELRTILLMLPPDAIHALAPMILQANNAQVESLLKDIVAIQITQAQENISGLIKALNGGTIRDLIRIIRDGNLPTPIDLLVDLTRHESPIAREAAARALIDDNPEHVRRIPHLIDDPNLNVNRLICQQIGRQRNQWGEKVLYDYLNDIYNRNLQYKDFHILNCYRALGMCASNQVLPYLKYVLLKKDIVSFFGIENNCHRKGAAIALFLMPPEWGTGEILEKAAQSQFRNIRLAYQQAEEEINRTKVDNK